MASIPMRLVAGIDSDTRIPTPEEIKLILENRPQVAPFIGFLKRAPGQ